MSDLQAERILVNEEQPQIRILYVCDGYPPERKVGGVEVYTQTVARGLIKRGHYASVVGFSDKVKQIAVEDDQGVRVIRVPFPEKGIIPRMIRARLLLESVIRKEIKIAKINLVETQDCGAPLLFGSFGVPLIVRMQGANFVYFANSGRKVSLITTLIQKNMYRIANHLVAVSDHIRRETFEKADIKNRSCDLIYNAVDLNQFKPEPEILREEGRILFVGRLTQTKGAPNLFAALPIIFSKYPNAKLRFIGKNPMDSTGRYASEKLMKTLPEHFAARVEIVGELPREMLPKEFSKASIAVFPSLVDANPFVVIESMACATPTVFMKSGPGPETIEDGKEGLLCDTTNPEDIANSIMKMLGDPDRAREMGQLARERVVKQFSLQRFMEKNEWYYLNILQS